MEQQAVPVAQEDREAACATYLRFRYGQPPLYTNIAAGRIDHDPIVQAFARHRLASLPCKSGEDEVDNLVRTVANWISFSSSCIKSGESWTATCETMKASAFKALDVLGNTNLAALTPDATQTREAETREGCVGTMDAERATYFLERFKLEEKLLGPHEQWALDFTIAALNARGGA